MLAFGYPVATALTVSASLAQIGEFSFILAGLGIALGLLPPEGRDLILAGALLSITLNPLVFAAVDPLDALAAGAAAAGGAAGAIGRPAGDAAGRGPSDALRDHAVIVGYGRVGELIGEVLKAQGFPFVVVEQNRRRVEELRARGLPAIYGDATAPASWTRPHVDARPAARRRHSGRAFRSRASSSLPAQANPQIETAVRTHSEAELAYLKDQGVGIAIMGKREVAFGMMRYALKSFGVTEDKARLLVQGIRTAGEGGAFERRPEPEPARAPELRPHAEKLDPAEAE